MRKVDRRGASSLGFSLSQLLLGASEKLSFQLKETTCPQIHRTWNRNWLGGLPGEMNWTNFGVQDPSVSSDAFPDNPSPLLCSGKSSC